MRTETRPPGPAPRRALRDRAAAPLLGALAAVALLAASPAGARTTGRARLAEAIDAMRRIDQSKMTEAEREAMGEKLDRAWKTISSAGKAAVPPLLEEIRKIDASDEKDDFFKLGAAELLWKIGRLDRCADVAQVWEGTPLTANYNYVFYTAFEAASTQDPRVLPMLRACLGDKDGSVFVQQHFLELGWPDTLSFLWGAFGPAGLDALNEVLETSREPVEICSAIELLSNACDLRALPRIRALAAAGKGEVRRLAVRALGVYGHPQDFAFLLAGLSSKDTGLAAAHVWALVEFDDLRAARPVLPLAKSGDDRLRQEALTCLAYLFTPASLAALHEHARGAVREEEKKYCDSKVASVLSHMKLDWKGYSALPPAEKEKLVARVRDEREDEYRLKPDDRRLTHDGLLRAARQWKAKKTIDGGKYEWVESRHVLAAATPDDIDLLLSVRAAVCLRLSDECIYEMRTLDELVKRLGRRRYRKAAGVCDRVEAK